MKNKPCQFGKLVITSDGTVFNTENQRLISLFNDPKGNPMFRSPDTKTNWRLDYIVAMMFLNNGKLISNIKEYYIKHKDGDPKNCCVDNLELITDKDEVDEIRFSFLRGERHSSNYEKKVYPLYVANRETCEIEIYSATEFSKKFKMSESTATKKAKNCERIYKDNFYLYVCDTMLDAWECL